MPPSDERRVTSGSRGEESGFINGEGNRERGNKTSNERMGRQRETEVHEAMVILDKRGWKEKDIWERAYEEKERLSVYSKKSCQGCWNSRPLREGCFKRGKSFHK